VPLHDLEEKAAYQEPGIGLEVLGLPFAVVEDVGLPQPLHIFLRKLLHST
jgi:hypothetical protein